MTPIAALFVQATDVWTGGPLWPFVGAVALGLLGPLGTWYTIKRYPETDRFAWVCLGLTAMGVTLLALPQLFVLLWA